MNFILSSACAGRSFALFSVEELFNSTKTLCAAMRNAFNQLYDFYEIDERHTNSAHVSSNCRVFKYSSLFLVRRIELRVRLQYLWSSMRYLNENKTNEITQLCAQSECYASVSRV